MQSKCIVNSLEHSLLTHFNTLLFHFGFTDLIYACDFTVFRDVIIAQESDKEEMISKYLSYVIASLIQLLVKYLPHSTIPIIIFNY